MKKIAHVFTYVTVGLAAVSCTSQAPKQEAKRSNIIFIMSDDHACQAISAYGDSLIKILNIGRIGKEGTRFTNCFVTNSLCSPSRAVILSGMYSHLPGARDNSFCMQMDSGVVTFPMLLQKAGYQTGIVGKMAFA